MGKDRRTLLRYARHIILSAVIDVIILFIAYQAAFSVRGVLTPLEKNGFPKLILVEALILPLAFYLLGVYRIIWSRTSGHAITTLIIPVAVSTLVILFVNAVWRPQPLPFSVIIIANVLMLGGAVAVRYRSRLISGLSWRWQAVWKQKFPQQVTRVLIVGTGQPAQELAVQLKHRAADKSKYRVVGFIDDDLHTQKMYIEGCPILGTHADIASVVESHNIDLVILAIHNISGPAFRDILSQCEQTKALIKVIPDPLAIMTRRENVSLLRDVQPEDLLGRKAVTRLDTIDMSAITGKTILVTGAAGSIGSELARQIVLYQPVKLILLDSNESGLHDLTVELKTKFPNVHLVQALNNITNRKSLETIFVKHLPQVVFHAAAYKHVPILEDHPNEAIQVNIGGTLNVAELAQQFNVERFVLISTDKAVNPSSVMGASKRICEMLLRALSQKPGNCTLFTSVRFGNVLGSRGSVVPTFNQQIDRGGPVTITDKNMTRYFMTIPEAVNLVIHAACLTRGHEVFLLKMGEEVRILDLAERMIRMRGLRPYKDIDIQTIGIRAGEKLNEQLYDGLAESAVETAHPGIIQLNTPANSFDPAKLLNWVNHILVNGIDPNQSALRQLLWNMTPNEKYAILGENGGDKSWAALSPDETPSVQRPRQAFAD
ncbi:MAG: polysaccharide biosynthesis protein [Chloroflexi bacterium]|nr:polysaccharide biosynthesis protein [Chloroflexota bacterium]